MFSHDMGGSQTTYSSVCEEFASYDFIVCAIEHRDESEARTFMNHSSKGLDSREEREANENVNHWEEETEKNHDVVDFL